MSTVFSSGSFNISKALSKFDSQGAQEKKMRHLQRPKKKLQQHMEANSLKTLERGVMHESPLKAKVGHRRAQSKVNLDHSKPPLFTTNSLG
jgi:hypothetical protein